MPFLLGVGFLGIWPVHAETGRWTLTNHAGDYSNELVRLKVALKPPFDATRLVVTEDGQEVPVQVEIRKGTPTAVEAGDLWVCTTIASKAAHEYTVTTGGAPKKFPPRVKVTRDGQQLVLDNGWVAVKLPATAGREPRRDALISAPAMPGPITAVRAGAGPWLGGSSWHTGLSFVDLSSAVVCDGTVFARWLRGPLREWAEALLDTGRLEREGYFHSGPIRQRWTEHLSGKLNWQYSRWNVLMFQAWLES